MKSIKVKKMNNSSFVTNHDLIECLRNKSFVATRDNSTRMHTNKSKVSLIEKKSYERMHTLQENNSLLANTTQITLSFADKAIVLVQDCLTTLGESSQKITHKLKKVIAYIREMQSEQSKQESSRRKLQKQTESEKALLRKLETSCQEKAILKMQNEQLKNKLNEYREKFSLIRKEKKGEGLSTHTTQPPEALHELIVNQSEVIDQQCEQNKRQGEEMRRMLHIQALQIEQMMKQRQAVAKQPSIRGPSNRLLPK